ncbi:MULTISPECIES: YqgQ family protein [Gracilibacillus]|uniref:YqgQ family protein n=1 Tax=Gracilibacillus TaxID=74385 RepID=UPI000826327B|nr:MULTISPECIES: YqgQ family protein [Gracilibacillus]
MKDMYEVRKLLLRFGTIIYSGDRLADLELMEDEFIELYQVNMITKDEWLQAKRIIMKEKEKTDKG